MQAVNAYGESTRPVQHYLNGGPKKKASGVVDISNNGSQFSDLGTVRFQDDLGCKRSNMDTRTQFGETVNLFCPPIPGSRSKLVSWRQSGLYIRRFDGRSSCDDGSHARSSGPSRYHLPASLTTTGLIRCIAHVLVRKSPIIEASHATAAGIGQLFMISL